MEKKMALLEVRDVAVHYPVKTPWFHKKRFLRAVDGVSFTLERGETIGLVGESGCGKSTLGRTLVKLEEPTRGEILLDGKDIRDVRGKELQRLRRKFQMIFQDPYGSLNPRLTIFTALDEVLSIHFDLSRAERREKAAALLTEVGLPPEILDRYPHQFSGGQRQRIGIARALAVEPDFIVADEPVSALDVSVQASIINLMQDIQRTKGTSFLFIAHDLAVVEHISRRIMVMYLGRIVESAPARELVKSPAHPYTKALLSAVPSIDGNTQSEKVVLTGDVPSPMDYPEGSLSSPLSLCHGKVPHRSTCAAGNRPRSQLLLSLAVSSIDFLKKIPSTALPPVISGELQAALLFAWKKKECIPAAQFCKSPYGFISQPPGEFCGMGLKPSRSSSVHPAKKTVITAMITVKIAIFFTVRIYLPLLFRSRASAIPALRR